MSKSQGWIYKIENKANGKIYVGQTIGFNYSTIKTHIKREAEILMKKYQIRNFIPGGVPLAA